METKWRRQGTERIPVGTIIMWRGEKFSPKAKVQNDTVRNSLLRYACAVVMFLAGKEHTIKNNCCILISLIFFITAYIMNVQSLFLIQTDIYWNVLQRTYLPWDSEHFNWKDSMEKYFDWTLFLISALTYRMCQKFGLNSRKFCDKNMWSHVIFPKILLIY